MSSNVSEALLIQLKNKITMCNRQENSDNVGVYREMKHLQLFESN